MKGEYGNKNSIRITLYYIFFHTTVLYESLLTNFFNGTDPPEDDFNCEAEDKSSSEASNGTDPGPDALVVSPRAGLFCLAGLLNCPPPPKLNLDLFLLVVISKAILSLSTSLSSSSRD